MLGLAFNKTFSQDYQLRCTDINVTDPWIDYLDFRDYDAYAKDVVGFAPDYLFHLGAHTDLEYCEQNIDDTYLTNALSVENAVLIADACSIPIVYISTAGILTEAKIPSTDREQPYRADITRAANMRARFMSRRMRQDT